MQPSTLSLARAPAVPAGALAILAGALAILAGTPTLSVAAPAVSCGRFVVGMANSTAYPNLQLPARGTASGAACSTLERIARRMNAGVYNLPSTAHAPAFSYGSPFAVPDRGRTWSCRFENRGLSGPSYAVRCRRGASRLRWQVG